ncbi:hypothetical protein PSJ8397_02469 [Pseudooctadecabacter jejudonensis]|uniref:Uncharacterized protein n=1 Tax=Pseudooctadecabacter jejudonensis TaxID=1391910 RepID=A0A1Y5ST23_9RHOB|nr:hypothetical protein PSJ8397_02469 [Pseudooctadecabacter jejudonensis]
MVSMTDQVLNQIFRRIRFMAQNRDEVVSEAVECPALRAFAELAVRDRFPLSIKHISKTAVLSLRLQLRKEVNLATRLEISHVIVEAHLSQCIM